MIIVTRAEWGAKPPKNTPVPIAIPTPELYLHHSAGSGSDEAAVRGIQWYHQTPPPDGRGWNDIAYSFLIDNDPPDVDVFEGRGAGIAGGHTKGRNTVSHAICVIGNYSATPPKAETLETIAQLVAYGHEQGWWPDRITGGHRDAPNANTTCPGDALYALIPAINARTQDILNPPEVFMPWPIINPDSTKSEIIYLQVMLEAAGLGSSLEQADGTGVWGNATATAVAGISQNQQIEGRELAALHVMAGRRSSSGGVTQAEYENHRHAEGKTGPPI